MIYAELLKNKSDMLLGFKLSGHANNRKSGQSIVCAAVSSVAYMVANTITDICKAKADVNVDDGGEMFLLISASDYNVCKDILSGFELHMKNLQEQYEEDINVSYSEV